MRHRAKTGIVTSACVLIALAGLLAAAAAAQGDAATIAKGRALIEANCARCHGIGIDDSSHHPDAPPFREVMKRYAPDNLAEALAEGIVSGHPDMPEFVFQPPEIEAIVAYLGTLQPPAKKD